MKKSIHASRIAAFVMAILFLIAALGIAPLSKLTLTSDAAYPVLVAGLSILFAVWIFFDEKKKSKQEKPDPNNEPEKKVLDKDILVIIGLMVGYAVLLLLIGYILSTLVFTIIAIAYLYEKNWKMGLLVGFISTFLIVLVFKYVFSVILP